MSMKESFFESCNKAGEAAYDRYFKQNEKALLKGSRESADKLETYIDNEMAKWSTTPLEELGGATPAEFVEAVSSLEDLMDMFKAGSIICDDKLPGIFLSKLKSFGGEAEEALLAFCSRDALIGEDESSPENNIQANNSYKVIMAVKVLDMWKSAKAAAPLLELLKYDGPERELVYESVEAALVSIGEPAAEGIINVLEAAGNQNEALCNEALEQLVMALAEIGRANRSDSYYRCLKNSFLRLPFKATAAASLAAYGDGRAIPALRGYIEREGSRLDKNTCYEIIAAIRSLGGRTDDLGIHFGGRI